jgi:hypothetical protein
MPTPSQKAKAFDKIYCTRLLLKYWPELREHCDITLSTYAQIDKVQIKFLMENALVDPDVFVESLTRSKERSQLLLTHVDTMLKLWESRSGGTYVGRLRRRIIRGLYLEEPRKTVAMIAAEEDKPRGAIGEYIQSSIQELSALFFGVDGLMKTREALYLHTVGVYTPGPGRR